VIYDLPGRDCAAKASNGELKVGELSRYKSEYIDPIVKILKAHSNTAFALIIEPDSLPNLVTNSDLSTCQQSASGYRDGVAYAIKQLNLPNVVMYIDAGHGGWLGWDANLSPGAKELANAYKAGGSPKQFRGFSTNVAGWNSWDQDPGEFANASDAKYNKCQNEKIYVKYGALLHPFTPPPPKKKRLIAMVPLHTSTFEILDLGNGRQKMREYASWYIC
jgi:cellulose 1,4-beta-cellobiosidase